MKSEKMLFTFWKIGQNVCLQQGICENIVSRYSDLLKYKCGLSETFSINNVHYMKKFYKSFPHFINGLDRLSFEHYKLLVDISDIKERYFYFRLALFCRSSVCELKSFINNGFYMLLQ